MKFSTLILLLIASAASAQFQYVSPLPNSTMNNPEHHIILREGKLIDASSITKNIFSVEGSKSGMHAFRVVFSSDHKTILLYPDQPFAFGEQVTVSINNRLRTTDGNAVAPYQFSFSTHREYTAQELLDCKNAKSILLNEEMKREGIVKPKDDEGSNTRIQTGSFTIVNNTNPTPGDIFYDAWSGTFGSNYDGYNIITTDGDSVFQSAKLSFCQDFDLNPNGYLSVFNSNLNRYDILDSNYHIFDSYHAGNGYTTDVHEFTMYSDHSFMTATETQVVDMSVYNSSWSTHANVTGGIVQEFDADKNVIFEWRAFDHVDVTESNQNLSFGYIDYTHTNAIDVDADGNLIVSNRHLDQVNKIDINTGNFIWRLGGDSNQFVFPNDADHFRWQHCARILPNGNLTLWDNGNSHVPQHSMAKEYQLDLTAKTATLVWSYQPKTYSNTNCYFYAMGSVQRLSNGNTLIDGGWDNSSNESNFWEVTSDGTIVWELALNNNKQLVAYRAAKRVWNPCAPVNATSVFINKLTDSSAKVNWGAVSNAASYDLQYRKLGNAIWKTKNTTHTNKKLKNLAAGKSYEYQLRTNCLNGNTSDWTSLDTFTTLPARYLNANDKSSAFNLYPNPASSVLHIDMKLETDAEMAIIIQDLAGKELITSTQSSFAGDQSLSFDVSALPSGCYLAEVTWGNNRQTMKFVKQ